MPYYNVTYIQLQLWNYKEGCLFDIFSIINYRIVYKDNDCSAQIVPSPHFSSTLLYKGVSKMLVLLIIFIELKYVS